MFAVFNRFDKSFEEAGRINELLRKPEVARDIESAHGEEEEHVAQVRFLEKKWRVNGASFIFIEE